MKCKTCKRCGKTYYGEKVIALAFYHSRKSQRIHWDKIQNRAVCRPCLQKERDREKKRNRWRDKFKRATESHAGSYIEAAHWRDDPNYPKVRSVAEFIIIFGWDIDKGAKAMENEYNNGCHRCRMDYQEMVHGYQDITVDIRNRGLPPDWENVQFLCMSCNREKGTLTPEEDQIMQRIYREHAVHMEKLKRDQGIGTLFAGIGVDFSASRRPLIKL